MNKRGSILIIALWILTVLVIFAVTIGHRAALNLKLARFQRDYLKANLLALSGVEHAIAVLNKDRNDYDSIKEEWSTGKDSASGLPIFENVIIKDEESFININGTKDSDKNRVAALLGLLQIQDFQELAKSITDWKNSESAVEIAKKEDFKVREEILAASEYFYKTVKNDSKFKERAKEFFLKIRDSISLASNGKVNINTCLEEPLRVLALTLENPLSVDSENLIQRIIQFRTSDQAFDKLDADDIKTKLTSTGPELTLAQVNLLTQLITYGLITVKSDNFRIEASGQVNNALKKITAIYNTEEHKIVLWRENL